MSVWIISRNIPSTRLRSIFLQILKHKKETNYLPTGAVLYMDVVSAGPMNAVSKTKIVITPLNGQ